MKNREVGYVPLSVAYYLTVTKTVGKKTKQTKDQKKKKIIMYEVLEDVDFCYISELG